MWKRQNRQMAENEKDNDQGNERADLSYRTGNKVVLT